MRLDTAPIADEHRDAECDVDHCDGVYVLHEGDRVCRTCGHISGSGTTRPSNRSTPWEEWWAERASDDYSGWYGEDRWKFVGGFARSYDFDTDF